MGGLTLSVDLGMSKRSSSSKIEDETSVIRWLLEKEQPAVRYRALVDLLDRKEDDPDVREARSKIGRVGWAADQLQQQGPNGFWERREPRNFLEWVTFLWRPMYGATLWRALVLSELGLNRTDPRIARAADQILRYKLGLSSPANLFYEEMCLVGNTARTLTRFGYGDDRRVRKLFDWLLEDQRDDGGWNCSQGTPGTLDVWEPMAAFATVPRAKRSPAMERAIARGAEFYLERKLFEEGRRYAPWFRFHYPNHYYYDVLVGLDTITQLGYGSDRRLRPALEILRKKRLANGSWLMDRLHPDVGPGMISPREMKQIRPLVIEPPEKPSKWITLKALTVLKRTNESG